MPIRRGRKHGPSAAITSKILAVNSNHAKGLLITACGVLVISPDGLLTRLIAADHWTMIFYRALFLAVGMWLVLGVTSRGRVWRQYQTLRGGALLKVLAYSFGTISFVFAITILQTSWRKNWTLENSHRRPYMCSRPPRKKWAASNF